MGKIFFRGSEIKSDFFIQVDAKRVEAGLVKSFLLYCLGVIYATFLFCYKQDTKTLGAAFFPWKIEREEDDLAWAQKWEVPVLPPSERPDQLREKIPMRPLLWALNNRVTPEEYKSRFDNSLFRKETQPDKALLDLLEKEPIKDNCINQQEENSKKKPARKK